jgi:hypothetical protein
MLGILEEGMTKTYDEEETMPIAIECAIDKMTDTIEEDQTMARATPRSKIGSNDVNTTPLKLVLCSTFGVESNYIIEIH